jgi:hypothetical protein
MARPTSKTSTAGSTPRRPNRAPSRAAGSKKDESGVVVGGPSASIGGRVPAPDAVGLIGEIRLAAGPAFSAATRLRVAGLNTTFEKEKLSITLDKPVVEEIRELFGGQPLSASINELLQGALVQHRLGLLVDQMEEEAGSASPEAYERVFAQWFDEE